MMSRVSFIQLRKWHKRGGPNVISHASNCTSGMTRSAERRSVITRRMARERKRVLKRQRIPAKSSIPHNATAITCKRRLRSLPHTLARYRTMSAPMITSNGRRPSRTPLAREREPGCICSEGICSAIDDIPFRDFTGGSGGSGGDSGRSHFDIHSAKGPFLFLSIGPFPCPCFHIA
jgi:hypothetical protein